MNIVKITCNGEFWYKLVEGQLVVHRDCGKPAIVLKTGTWWFKNGLIHNDDGPAVVNTNGDKYYYKEGKPCSPTKISPVGSVYWYSDDSVRTVPGKHSIYPKLHRLDGPAIIIGESKKYYINNRQHHYNNYLAMLIKMDPMPAATKQYLIDIIKNK